MNSSSTHRKERDQPRRQRQPPVRLEQLLEHCLPVQVERLGPVMPLEHDLDVLARPASNGGSVEGRDKWGGQ